MRNVLVAIGCLVSATVWASEGYWPEEGVPYDAEVGRTRSFRHRGPGPPGYQPLHMRLRPRWTGGDALEREIARLESLFNQGTPAPSGRFGEVTARFGPQWSPYFQEQIQAWLSEPQELPAPGTPEAHALLVDLAGRALRRRNTLVAGQLLALYELRAIKRLAERGVTPQMAGVGLARDDGRMAARLAEDYLLSVAGSVVKVATYRDPVGYPLQHDGGPRILDVLAFTPDGPDNIVLMLALQATMQRIGDSPSTAAFRLEAELLDPEVGSIEVVNGPTIALAQDDPVMVQKGRSFLLTGTEGTWDSPLRDQPRYTLRLTTPDGAIGGGVKVTDVVVKVYYVTGGFVEAGTIR